MDTDDLVLFVRVAELGSLSAAGRDLRMTPAVVSSRIIRLEKHLGVRLLNRTTRRVSLTPDGETFLRHSLRLLKELDAAHDAVAVRRDQPAGSLKISAPVAFAKLHIAPYVAEFVGRYPQVQVRLVASDRFVDFFQEQIDLAVRVAELRDSSFIVRRLAPNRRILCAAPSYLDAGPAIATPADLLEHNCLLLRFPGSQQYRWTLTGPSGATETLQVGGSMDSDNGEIITEWCLAGHGIALKSLWEVGPYLRDGRLRAVLPDHEAPGHSVHALYPHSHYLPPRVRAFIDFLVEKIGDPPYWEAGSGAGTKKGSGAGPSP